MKKLYFLILALSQLVLSQSTILQDTVILDNGTKYPCYIKELGSFIGLIEKNQITRYEELKYINEIYIADYGIIYSSNAGYLKNQEEIQNFLTERTLNTRGIGLILGSGLRTVDENIRDHLGGYFGPIYIAAGIEVPLSEIPISIEFIAEAGISGQIQNSYKEIYTFFDLKFGGKLAVFPKRNKFNLIVDGGIMYISAKIDDNVDGNSNDFFTSSGVDFQEGTLIKSATGVGPYFDFGLNYRLSGNWDLAGLIQMNFIDLNFSEFTSNALGPGFALKLNYYPGER